MRFARNGVAANLMMVFIVVSGADVESLRAGAMPALAVNYQHQRVVGAKLRSMAGRTTVDTPLIGWVLVLNDGVMVRS